MLDLDVKIGQKVELTSSEQLVCKGIAKSRYESNRSASVGNAKIGSQSDEVTDLEGFAAEMAFCKLFNVYPDFSVQPRSSVAGEDDGDARLRDGRSVDVKGTKYPNGKLVAVPWKKPQVDLFALMVGSFPKYEFKGFMRRDDLLQTARLGTLGYGPTYIAAQKELQPLVNLQ